MRKGTWKGDDHLLPKSEQRKTLVRVWDNTTTPLSHKEHVERHRDVKKYSVIGSITRLDLKRRSKRHAD